MTQTMTGMDFSSDSTEHDFFHLNRPQRQSNCVFNKVLLHLLRLCSSLEFFPQSIPMIRMERRIKIFQISSIIFLLLVSKHTIHGDHFELSPPQTPDFSVVSRHSQPIFPSCDSFPTNGYYLFAHHLLHGPSGGPALLRGANVNHRISSPPIFSNNPTTTNRL